MLKNKHISLGVFIFFTVIPSLGITADVPKKNSPKVVATPKVVAAPKVATAPEDLGPFSENKVLVALIADDNAASDLVLDAAWGEHNPFNSTVMASLPARVAGVPERTMGSTKFILSGIIWNVARPSAIINNQVVGVDTAIYGSTVTEIKENTVILSDGTESLILKLHD